MEFKVGDKIVYLGTKEGMMDNDWQIYFGRHGIKKGSKGVITTIETSGGIFIKEDGRPDTSGRLFKCDIRLAKAHHFKNPTHLVVWEVKGCGDPCKFFTNEKDAKEEVKKLSDQSDVKKDSIILVEIKSAQKVNVIKNVRLNQYKI